MKILLSIGLLILITSCGFFPHRSLSEKEMRAIFNEVQFEDSILLNLDKYNDLYVFLNINFDTILNYRNQNNKFIVYRPNSPDDTIIRREDCNRFLRTNPNFGLEKIPPFLRPELKEIWYRIGYDCQFEICTGKEVRFSVKYDKLGMGVYISHDLIWNQCEDQRAHHHFIDDLTRDTILMDNCIYRLGFYQDIYLEEGW